MSVLLKQLASTKRDPEFAATVREITHAIDYAGKMRKAGKLSKAEFEDFEAAQYDKYIEALPPDEFHEMMKDGRLEQLQALSSHDGARDDYEVKQNRRAIENKIKGDALDEAWLGGKIDAKHYAQESREIASSFDEDLDNRMAHGDYDGVASERFANRNDAPPNHDSAFAKMFPEMKTEGRAERVRASSHVVDHDAAEDDGFVDHDAEG